MIQKLFLLFTLILICQLTFSQDRFIRISPGITRTNVLRDPSDIFSLEDEFKTGFILQLTYNQEINESFYWGAGLGYFQKGFKLDVELFDEFANPLGTETFDWRFNYMGLPAYFGFQSGDKLRFFADAGLTPSILINSEITGQGDETDVTEFIDDFDLSFSLTLGLRNKLNDSNAIEAGVSFQQSLIGVDFFNTGGSDITYSHIGFAFIIGLTHQL